MQIEYCGHSCFKFSTKPLADQDKVTAVIDPFGKKLGIKPPRGNADLVLVTHEHYDHNDTSSLKGDFFLINNPGEYSFRGISIIGLQTYHDDQGGKLRGLNTIYIIESEDFRICHLGDLGHLLEKNQLDKIGEVDVLMVPVGGKYTIGPQEAVKIMRSIEPSMVIAMHYNVPGLKVEGLGGVDDFYKELGVKPQEKLTKLKLKKGKLEEGETDVVELTPC
jgi:L-ascorbate metabolism protein UlaG (beta-lactamase superfamily)